WIVRTEGGGIPSSLREAGGVCVPRDDLGSGRLGYRVKTGETYRGPSFSFLLWPGDGTLELVRDLQFEFVLDRAFAVAARVDSRGSPAEFRATRALRASDVDFVRDVRSYGFSSDTGPLTTTVRRQFLLVVEPSNDQINGIQLRTRVLSDGEPNSQTDFIVN
ncbi:MAG: hypothetical protein AAGI01_04400, partial [Myxococcota bacterium]